VAADAENKMHGKLRGIVSGCCLRLIHSNLPARGACPRHHVCTLAAITYMHSNLSLNHGKPRCTVSHCCDILTDPWGISFGAPVHIVEPVVPVHSLLSRVFLVRSATYLLGGR
jgi:hypothetical protein